MAGIEDLFIGDENTMAVHGFEVLLEALVSDRKTESEVKTIIESEIGRSLDMAESAELTTLMDYVDQGSSYSAQNQKINELTTILVMSEMGYDYDTKPTLRTALMDKIT